MINLLKSDSRGLQEKVHHGRKLFEAVRSGQVPEAVVDVGRLAERGNLGDYGSSRVYPPHAISPLEGSPKLMEELDRLKVVVEVTNTGSRPGEEVVQLCVGAPDSAVERPVKLLRGFRRIFLRPGERERLPFEIPLHTLAWYNPQKTRYAVYVGSSSSANDV